MTKPFVIAVTGQRSLGDAATIEFVTQTFRSILKEVQVNHPDRVIALSGLADGADILFAEIAAELKIPVEAVLAHKRFAQDLPDEAAREHYQQILAQCSAVHQLPFEGGSPEAYFTVGKTLVERSHLLVAVWDGAPAAGVGGTSDIVHYADVYGCPVRHIHTQKRRVIRREFQAIPVIDRFEEYKLFVDDTARFSERRQTVTNTYITVNGAIAGLITFLAKDSGLNNIGLVIFMIPLILFGAAICWYWQQLIERYKQLVRLRIAVLREMEQNLPGSIRMYHREDRLYPRDAQGRLIQNQGLNISDWEKRLPFVFIGLYILFLLALVIGTALISSGILSPVVVP